MDVLSRIATWLSDHEATISAVAAIIVIGGVVFAGFRWLLRRGGETSGEAAPRWHRRNFINDGLLSR